MWRSYLLTASIACVVSAVTAFLTVQLTPSTSPRTQVLEGVAAVPFCPSVNRPEEGQLEVFYKVPFAQSPHLTFPEGLIDGERFRCRLLEQKAGSFKLQRESISGADTALVKWRAEGIVAP